MRTAPALTVAVAAVTLLAVATFSGVARAFTSVSPPLTGATDFVTGAPFCGGPIAPFGGEGPVGMAFDASHFFVTDLCNHTTYWFPLTGGDFPSAEAVMRTWKRQQNRGFRTTVTNVKRMCGLRA